MTVEMMQNYAFKDGMEKGKSKKAEESAVNLLKKGVSETMIVTPEQVTQVTALPLEKVQELAKEIGE